MKYTGLVQHGQGRGGMLGFATANIPLSDVSISGIFIASVTLDGKAYPAAAFADQKRKLLEAYILDFSQQIYEKQITIELLKKIRDTKNFESDEEMRVAIANDVACVREYFRDTDA